VITRSLKRRLLVGVLLVVSLIWGAWLGMQVVQRTRDHTGVWDATLSETAKEILLSLPSNMEIAVGLPTLMLPPAESFKGDMASYQVWLKQKTNALHSPGAPGTPLKPDFRDGFADVTMNGVAWRVYAITDSTGTVQVQLGKRYAVLNAELAQWTRSSLLTAGSMLVLLGCVIWLIVRWSLEPVTAVRQSILARAGLDMQPLPTRELPLEIEPLVDAFNRLLAELDGAVQAERRFIADAAHELRTPLAALLNQAQIAMAARDPAEQHAALLRLQAVAERSGRLSEQLLDLARLESWRAGDSRTPVDLSELVMLVLRDFESAASAKRQQLVVQAQSCPITGHVDGLGILIRNLIDNAIRYTPEGGRIVVQCRPSPDGAPALSVADSGPGVPREDRPRIFERFYRVPGNSVRGSGIGLSLVSRIALLHGARIEVGDGLDGRGFGISVRFAAS
jgi:two-component system, OmpR family, sensor histidine kinase QseC